MTGESGEVTSGARSGEAEAMSVREADVDGDADEHAADRTIAVRAARVLVNDRITTNTSHRSTRTVANVAGADGNHYSSYPRTSIPSAVSKTGN